jgi:hypothetical protein
VSINVLLSPDSKGVFTIGDEIKITLTLNEKVTLANVGRNRVVVSGKEFLLTGTNGAVTKTLEFVYSVKANDKIVAKSRHYDIILTEVLLEV